MRQDRHGDLIELTSSDALPQMPDWLTAHGQEVWQDDVARVAGHLLATEEDSTAFGNYCNLQGEIIKAWRDLANCVEGATVPPTAALTEVRRMAEQFGLFGRKSRLVSGGAQKAANSFAKHGRRS